MKSGMGIDQVYLQTLSGESAMVFVIGIATLLSDVIAKVLKDNGIGKTSKTINEELVSLILKEGPDGIVALGKDDSIDQLETYFRLSRLDMDSLLGYSESMPQAWTSSAAVAMGKYGKIMTGYRNHVPLH